MTDNMTKARALLDTGDYTCAACRGDGPCPFEAAVMEITHPTEALAAIRRKLAQL